MARPAKNHCDYFPHDIGMRDHKKIKAIRSKFGITGYAIWVMTLEYLTGNDGNVFQYSDLEFELMAGDFGVSATEIRSVIDYCISLELLFNEKGFIKSESLDDRLAPVYEKRGKAKELSKKQLRVNGKYTSSNAGEPVVSVAEMPQSKVNESKVNQTKEKETKSGADKSATPEERALDFRNKVAEHLNEYSKEMLRSFYDYWTEMNDGGRKMRFETHKIFNIKKRLTTWKNNESKFGKKGANGFTTKREQNASELKQALANSIMQEFGNGQVQGGC